MTQRDDRLPLDLSARERCKETFHSMSPDGEPLCPYCSSAEPECEHTVLVWDPLDDSAYGGLAMDSIQKALDIENERLEEHEDCDEDECSVCASLETYRERLAEMLSKVCDLQCSLDQQTPLDGDALSLYSSTPERARAAAAFIRKWVDAS